MHESGEMYLETILILSKEKENVRSIDICEKLGYSKPSVSRAVSILKKDGLIVIDGKGYISLTENGKEIAKSIYERHETLTKALISLGISEETAVADACKVEHFLSEETFIAIKKHLNNFSE